MINVTPDDIGRFVRYVPQMGNVERGVITSVSLRYVFVRYFNAMHELKETPQATRCADLQWEQSEPIEMYAHKGTCECGGMVTMHRSMEEPYALRPDCCWCLLCGRTYHVVIEGSIADWEHEQWRQKNMEAVIGDSALEGESVKSKREAARKCVEKLKREAAARIPHAGDFHWEICLDVECPHCTHYFDANDTPDFSEQLRGKGVCEAVVDCMVTCPECEREFLFDILAGT